MYEYTVTTKRRVVTRTTYTVVSARMLDVEDLDNIILAGQRPAGVSVMESSEVDDDVEDGDSELTAITDETTGEDLL